MLSNASAASRLTQLPGIVRVRPGLQRWEIGVLEVKLGFVARYHIHHGRHLARVAHQRPFDSPVLVDIFVESVTDRIDRIEDVCRVRPLARCDPSAA